jgi:hypothetical protein
MLWPSTFRSAFRDSQQPHASRRQHRPRGDPAPGPGHPLPDPVKAALDAEEAGADGITVHLREDRRHIQERDVLVLKDVLQTRMNFEMGVTEEMMAPRRSARRTSAWSRKPVRS